LAVKYAKVAVSEVTFWVDRPYSYAVPESMADAVRPGVRVTVPFSRSNRKAEGVVLDVADEGDYDAPKAIISVLDEEPVLTDEQLRLAFWMRERFFCTVFEAVKAMLPAGLWFRGDGSRKVSDKLCEWARLEISGEEAAAFAAQLLIQQRQGVFLGPDFVKAVDLIAYRAAVAVDAAMTAAAVEVHVPVGEEKILRRDADGREQMLGSDGFHGCTSFALL